QDVLRMDGIGRVERQTFDLAGVLVEVAEVRWSAWLGVRPHNVAKAAEVGEVARIVRHTGAARQPQAEDRQQDSPPRADRRQHARGLPPRKDGRGRRITAKGGNWQGEPVPVPALETSSSGEGGSTSTSERA